jgi:hypothetical protein
MFGRGLGYLSVFSSSIFTWLNVNAFAMFFGHSPTPFAPKIKSMNKFAMHPSQKSK